MSSQCEPLDSRDQTLQSHHPKPIEANRQRICPACLSIYDHVRANIAAAEGD